MDGEGIRLRILEKTPPGLPSPLAGPIHPSLRSTRDLMIVEGLAAGKYLLKVDGQEVVSGSHEEWANGLLLDQSPAHREADSLRLKVNDKNLQFTYSWKALNQVHIVGERRKSPAGAALPGEVVQFNYLANKKDEQLGRALQAKTRNWNLIRQ